MSPDILADLFLTFARLSLVAIGGINAILPELYREVVEVRGWISAGDFADMVALAQASPGPNGLVSALIGWRVGGLAGFFTAALAVSVPPAVLAFGLSRVRRRLAGARWLRAAQGGLVPVVVGLMLASGMVTARAADDTLAKVALTVVVTLLVWRTRLNPLWLLGAGALAGLTGLASL